MKKRKAQIWSEKSKDETFLTFIITLEDNKRQKA